jgi:hypothetical protein
VAEKERLPKKELRAQARAERKRKEEEARKQAQKKRMINTAATVGVLAVIVVILIPTVQRFFGGDGDQEIELTAAAVADAREAAGCVVTAQNQPQPEPYTHYEPAQAPPADALYTATRPTHSGPHFISPISPVNGIPRNPIDERGSTHNLEHGAVIVWFDPDGVDGTTQRAMEAWQQERAEQGFVSPRSGGAIFVSPYDGTFSEDKPIAVRAWGQAIDCDEWDETYADGFLIDYYGMHGIAPERSLTPYPDGVLGYTDREVEDNTEAPTGDRHNTGDPESPADPSETTGATEPEPTEATEPEPTTS